MPIQRTNRWLSVRYANTISGGASIRWVISIAPVKSSITAPSSETSFRFRKLAQPAQVACPHLSQHGLERAERSPVGPVVPVGPLPPLREQARILEQSQVL